MASLTFVYKVSYNPAVKVLQFSWRVFMASARKSRPGYPSQISYTLRLKLPLPPTNLASLLLVQVSFVAWMSLVAVAIGFFSCLCLVFVSLKWSLLMLNNGSPSFSRLPSTHCWLFSSWVPHLYPMQNDFGIFNLE